MTHAASPRSNAPPSPGRASSSEGASSRDLDLARDAFELGDSRLSRAAHSSPAAVTEAGHPKANVRNECASQGAFDGIIAAVVVCAAASTQERGSPIIVSAAALVGFALVSGVRTYVQASSAMDHYDHERSREQWEMQNFVEGERTEMVELFTSEGVSQEDAAKSVAILSKPEYEDFFVDLMMAKELNMQMPDRSCCPTERGCITAGAFLASGSLLLTMYQVTYAGGLTAALQHVLDLPGLLVVVAGVLLAALWGLHLWNVTLIPRRSTTWVYGVALLTCGIAATSTAAFGRMLATQHGMGISTRVA